ncbi:MAG: flagellar motor switch protein FliM [Gallionella sp.]|nr:flagellar motor switch protein FliM [Gallionella sp.]
MSEFLSQDEVDSLLKGVTGESDEADAASDSGEGVRPYNLASQERIVRGRMPTMEIINERFARLFRIGLFNFIRRTPEISVGPVRVMKFGEFVRNLHVPTNLNLIQAKPLRGNGLFIFDPNLVFLIVDNMFGGDGRYHTRVEGREFTQTEQRIIQKMLGVAFETYGKSWEGVHPLTFEFVRSEMNPQFANIATPNEVVIVTSFDIELGGNGGAFHICMPYSMLEPIKDLLFSQMQGDRMAVDHRWLQLLAKQVQSASVELIATLGSATVTLEQVLKMHDGDVIPLEVSSNIIAAVDGVPVMECKYGTFNNQYALRVEKMLGGSEGDQHG